MSSPHHPLEVSIYPPVPANGATEAYDEFDLVYSEAERGRIADLAQSLARIAVPGISNEDVLVSCFPGGYTQEDMEATDQTKLTVSSSVPEGGFLEVGTTYDLGFDGDDSNQANIIERDRQELRNQRIAVNEELRSSYEDGSLTEAMQTQARQRIQAINDQIRELGEHKATSQLPVYYATTLNGLRTGHPEDNPLAYAGELPGTANMALYNGTAMRKDPKLQLSLKDAEQVRIAGHGQDIMNHALAVVQLVFR